MSQAGEMSSSAFLESIWGRICVSFLLYCHCLSHWITFMAQEFPVGLCGAQHGLEGFVLSLI